MPTRRNFLAATALAALRPTFSSSASLPASSRPALASSLPILLVDDQSILYRPGTKRTLHPLFRHQSNPLIKGGETPWARDIAFCSVSRNASGSYQMWYQAYAGSTARDRTRRCTVCYAESDDGISWRRPKLDLFDFDGATGTNIVLIANGGKSDRYGASVVVDPRDPNPVRRYKMVYFDFAKREGVEYPGLCVAFSPDGIHWTKHPDAPLLVASYGNKGEAVPLANDTTRPWAQPLAMSDALDVFWDPIREVFAIYGKMWIDDEAGNMYGKHAAGRTQSKDFIHWETPDIVIAPDEHDPPWVEFHTTPVFYHAGVYFACPQILNRSVNNGVMDIELATSRDGIHFTRPFRDTFFLPRNQGNHFDSGSVFTNASPVILDDEIRFYYGGYSAGATGPQEFVDQSGIGLATMKRDRFAGLRPIDKIAQITLRPLKLDRLNNLLVNANATNGSLRVEILDQTGRRIPGYTKEDAVPLQGDDLRHKAQWKNKQLSDLPPNDYIIRIHLDDAEVFALG